MAKLNIGMMNHRFKTDDRYLYHTGAYGNSFKILMNDIESVSVEGAGMSRCKSQNKRPGTCLAQLKMVRGWANKAQDFIQREVIDQRPSQDSTGSISDLEKLAELKEKKIISEDEFEAKKKQILGL